VISSSPHRLFPFSHHVIRYPTSSLDYEGFCQGHSALPVVFRVAPSFYREHPPFPPGALTQYAWPFAQPFRLLQVPDILTQILLFPSLDSFRASESYLPEKLIVQDYLTDALASKTPFGRRAPTYPYCSVSIAAHAYMDPPFSLPCLVPTP